MDLDPAVRRLCQELTCLDRLERTPGASDQLRRCLLSLALSVQPSIRAWIYTRRLMIFAGVTCLLTGLLYGLVEARDPKLDDMGKLDLQANRHWLLGTPVLILTAVIIFLAAQLVNNYIWLASMRVKRQLRARLAPLLLPAPLAAQNHSVSNNINSANRPCEPADGVAINVGNNYATDSDNNKEVYL